MKYDELLPGDVLVCDDRMILVIDSKKGAVDDEDGMIKEGTTQIFLVYHVYGEHRIYESKIFTKEGNIGYPTGGRFERLIR